MYKHCADQVIRRCVLEQEMESILNHCHTLACGGGGGGGGGALWGSEDSCKGTSIGILLA